MVQFRTALSESFATGTSKLSLVFAVLVVMSTTGRFSDAHNCTSSQDCGGKENGYQCCSGLCVQGRSCLGQDCKINHDCSTSEVCCNKKCVDNWNCLGQSCSFGDDCQWNETCCYGSCKENTACNDLTIIILICPLAIIVAVSIFSCICRNMYNTSSLKQRSPYSLLSYSTETTLSSTLSSPINFPGRPKKIPSHSTIRMFYTPASAATLPEDISKKAGKECKTTNPAAKTWYGSVCETVPP